MNCNQCGKQIPEESRFCRFCGHENISIEIEKSKVKLEKVSYFDLSAESTFLQSIVITSLLTISIFEAYFYLDSESSDFYFYSASLFTALYTVLSGYKGFSQVSLLISLAGIFVAYFFGGVFSLPFIIWLLMTNPSLKIRGLSLIKRALISEWAKNGVIWMTIGAAVTVGSILLADEGETYYLLYGASLVGAYYLLRGAFHSLFPFSLDNAEQKVIQELIEQEQNVLEPEVIESGQHRGINGK